MKILFTLKPKNKASGGGNFFVNNLMAFLKDKNHSVVFNFEDNIDLIIIINPIKNKSNHISYNQVNDYKKNNPNVKIIHRVNECDIKREKSINIEPKLLEAMKIADKVIFVSKWLEEYFITKYKLKINSTAILNGCNREHFFPKTKNLSKKIKIVTHHWSDNFLKGFHIYNEIDKLLKKHKNLEFVYIGRYNKNYTPKRIKLVPPKKGLELGSLLRDCDIYLTATQNEPGAMHYLEGISCGLPVLYCTGGGGVQEICYKYGEEFSDIDTFLEKLEVIKNNYNNYVNKIDYKYLSSERCCQQYYDEIIKLI